ncbi:ADP-ribosylglycohydrolase family protein [Anaerosphaera multitolerans]|uniref:ADP-ribosylglycohydrolase n=1 Tax=Anaerosphaera multitolerans TaxID=2487351 RepID=A0A437S8Y6_9FIRM|nr:ADP-ribosylglycohydrolase family protein [Anaerosphaera multitolerans]RVU55482.1 ADP-ribosylglycohydrolase [Anaerosphaera multitolerans]
MIGAIIGDIVGSRFQFDNFKNKDFEFFTEECTITDDSIMTFAVAKTIMDTTNMMKITLEEGNSDRYYFLIENMVVEYMQNFGKRYPYYGYGQMFGEWLFSENPKPYKSYGNGAAMRIVPAGFIVGSEEEVRKLSGVITGVTHNHPEGLKGAEAVVMAMFLSRQGCSKSEIKSKIEKDYYTLDFSLDELRETYTFDYTCQGTVPPSIVAFLESTSYEDAIRNAVSLGGYSDIVASITGGIAEAYYTVPGEFKEEALTYLDGYLKKIYSDWTSFTEENSEV